MRLIEWWQADRQGLAVDQLVEFLAADAKGKMGMCLVFVQFEAPSIDLDRGRDGPLLAQVGNCESEVIMRYFRESLLIVGILTVQTGFAAGKQCLPLDKPININATGVRLSEMDVIAGQIPSGDGSAVAVGTVAIKQGRRKVGESPLSRRNVDGSDVELTASCSLWSTDTTGQKVCNNANLSGQITLSDLVQADVLTHFSGDISSADHASTNSVYWNLLKKSSKVCVSGIGINLGYTNIPVAADGQTFKAGTLYGGRVYLYLNDGKNVYDLLVKNSGNGIKDAPAQVEDAELRAHLCLKNLRQVRPSNLRSQKI